MIAVSVQQDEHSRVFAFIDSLIRLIPIPFADEVLWWMEACVPTIATWRMTIIKAIASKVFNGTSCHSSTVSHQLHTLAAILRFLRRLLWCLLI